MANFDQKDHKRKDDEATSTLDQALLDEFFSIIASITVRLTKDNDYGKNGDDSIKQEVNKR
jgi:hypothetical protein